MHLSNENKYKTIISQLQNVKLDTELKKLFFSKKIFKHSHNFYPEILLVQNNLKPVMRTYWVSEKNSKIVKAICKKNNLFCTFSNFSKEEEIKINKSNNFHSASEKNYFLYISKSQTDSNTAMRTDLFGEKENLSTFSSLMGYPNCCFSHWNRYKNNNLLSNLINNSYHFDYHLNFFQKEYPSYLISHTPCNFNCKNSVKLAKESEKLLLKEFKLESIKPILSYTILIFDLQTHIKFIMEENGTYSFGNSTHDILWKPFSKGNKFQIVDNKIKIFKNNNQINELLLKKNTSPNLIMFE